MTQEALGLRSSLLESAGFKHAFFTRHGGCSTGEYQSLNFSYAVGDEPNAVDENFARAGRSLGLSAERLYFLAQVHGATAIDLETGAAATRAELMHVQGDALVSGDASAACCVRTADCLPILVADQSTGRVAAIHAGWRGLVGGVIPSALVQLGGDPRNCLAAIGPHITVQHFEVSDEVARELAQCSPALNVVRRGDPRPFVDLEAVARAHLLHGGLAAAAIDRVGGCTYADSVDYFSFRRQGRQSGRHLSAIVPR